MQINEYQYKKIKVIFRVLILILLIFWCGLKIFKSKLLKYNTENKDKIMSFVSKHDVKVFNLDNNVEQSIFNNKITIINVLTDNEKQLSNNLNKNQILLSMFGNKINIVDFIVRDKGKNGQSPFDEIAMLIDTEVEDFIKINNVKYPTLFFTKDITDDLKDNMNKVLIFDERFNLKSAFDNNATIGDIKNTMINISKQTKFLRRLKNSKNTIVDSSNDEYLLGNLSHFIIVENNKNYDIPVLFILDSDKKQLILTTIKGEIINIIKLDSTCFISNLKEYKDFIYLSDACNGIIYSIDLEDNNVQKVVQNDDLIGIKDFEFVNNEQIIFTKDNNNSVEILNIATGELKQLQHKYNIGNISNIVVYMGKYYFFDSENNKIYYYDFNSDETKLYLEIDFSNKAGVNIEYFYISNLNNIYFLDKNYNRIFLYDGKNVSEKTFKNYLYLPKDLKIFRNYYYFLSNNYLQKLNYLTSENEDLKLSFYKKFAFNVRNIVNNEIILEGFENEYVNKSNIDIELLFSNGKFLPNSPSYLLLFEKNDNNLVLIKNFKFDDKKNIKFDVKIEKNKEYVLYGNIVYLDTTSDIIKVKVIKKIITLDKGNKSLSNSINFIF